MKTKNNRKENLNKFILSSIPITIIAPTVLIIPLLILSGILISSNHLMFEASKNSLLNLNIGQINHEISKRVENMLKVPTRMTHLNSYLIQSGTLDPKDLPTWREVFFK